MKNLCSHLKRDWSLHPFTHKCIYLCTRFSTDIQNILVCQTLWECSTNLLKDFSLFWLHRAITTHSDWLSVHLVYYFSEIYRENKGGKRWIVTFREMHYDCMYIFFMASSFFLTVVQVPTPRAINQSCWLHISIQQTILEFTNWQNLSFAFEN